MIDKSKRYIIQYNEKGKNDHFQNFMMEYIGRKVRVVGVKGTDDHGHLIVFAELVNPRGVENISHIHWREYDLKPEDTDFISKDEFEL